MKRVISRSVLILFFITLLFFNGCPTTEDIGEFTVTVTVDQGVDGTPSEGTYNYDAGVEIGYNYTLKENFLNLVVTLDGEEVEPFGTLTVTGDHILKADSDPEFNIVGDWNLTEAYDDGSSFESVLTFTGDKISGTVTDSYGGTGSYEVIETNIMLFNLDFPDVSYKYTGSFSTLDEITGSSERITSDTTHFGSWAATRITTTTAFRKNRGPQDKGK